MAWGNSMEPHILECPEFYVVQMYSSMKYYLTLKARAVPMHSMADIKIPRDRITILWVVSSRRYYILPSLRHASERHHYPESQDHI